MGSGTQFVLGLERSGRVTVGHPHEVHPDALPVYSVGTLDEATSLREGLCRRARDRNDVDHKGDRSYYYSGKFSPEDVGSLREVTTAFLEHHRASGGTVPEFWLGVVQGE